MNFNCRTCSDKTLWWLWKNQLFWFFLSWNESFLSFPNNKKRKKKLFLGFTTWLYLSIFILYFWTNWEFLYHYSKQRKSREKWIFCCFFVFVFYDKFHLLFCVIHNIIFIIKQMKCYIKQKQTPRINTKNKRNKPIKTRKIPNWRQNDEKTPRVSLNRRP